MTEYLPILLPMIWASILALAVFLYVLLGGYDLGLGVLFPLALWRTAVVRWLAFALNGLMLIATPAYGSHYVVDVIAGVIVAVACWIVVMRLVSPNADAKRKHLAGIEDSPSIVPETLPEPDMVKLSRTREQA